MSARADILKNAFDLTTVERNRTYGDPVLNHENIAAAWNTYLDARRSGGKTLGHLQIDAEDAMLMMVLLKVVRAAQRMASQSDPHARDTFADMVAYAAMAGEAREVRNCSEPSVAGNPHAYSGREDLYAQEQWRARMSMNMGEWRADPDDPVACDPLS